MVENFLDDVFIDDTPRVSRSFFLTNTLSRGSYVLDSEKIREKWFKLCCHSDQDV
jgi:hypothetical protein